MLGDIFKEFSKRRKKEKIGAWAWLQSALADNASILCPTAVSLKDLIAATANIEDLLGNKDVTEGQTPTEYLADFLSGKEKEKSAGAKGTTQ